MAELAQSPIAPKSSTKLKMKIASDVTAEVVEDIIDLGFEPDPNKTYIFEVLKKSDALRIENLGSRCRIYDPLLKRYRELRYISVAPTIYHEQQHESYDNYPDTPLSFTRNQIYVKGSDRRLMEYMLNHDLCESSPFRISNKPAMFKLLDKDVEEEIKASRHRKEMEALKAIDDMPIDDLRPIARIIFNITETTEVAIRNAMNDLVKVPKKGNDKANSEKILDNLVNPKLNRQYYIQTGFDLGILASNRDRMDVRFLDGNVFICNLSTVNPKAIVNEMTDWSFSLEGQKFYAILRQKI